MKYKNVPKLLAEEAWRMITEECKEKMNSIKDVYIESLAEDIKYYINQISNQNSIDFAEWLLDSWTHPNFIYKEPKELLEIFKKEKEF